MELVLYAQADKQNKNRTKLLTQWQGKGGNKKYRKRKAPAWFSVESNYIVTVM